MSDEPRTIDWRRFPADFANIAEVPRCSATLGVGADTCDCCDARRVIIAAIHGGGAEISVALSPEVAMNVANAIIDAVQTLTLSGGARN